MLLRRQALQTASDLLGAIAVPTATVSAYAQGETRAKKLGLKGYDPVAYFTQNAAVEGSEQFSYSWLGATWHFASAENHDLFAADPVKYAPQYGGLCADGVSFGTVTTNIDPKAWRIIDGKLYLAYDPGAVDGFGKNATKVANSQKYWPDVNGHLAAEKQAQDWK